MNTGGYFKSLFKRMMANFIEIRPPTTPSNHQNTYPMSPYPFGWYALCPSHKVVKKHPTPLSFFGRELVAYRDSNNIARVFDAHCPHMGAHLGYSGTIRDGSITCPFHGWSFNAQGECVNAPFAKKTPCHQATRLKNYPAVEMMGMLLIWFHIDHIAPLFSLATLPEADRKQWTKAKKFSIKYRSHVQEIRENFCDETHFHFVHRQKNPASIIFESNGPVATVKSSLAGLTEFNLPRYPTVKTEATMYGPGIMAVRTQGFIRATSIALSTPINKDLVQFHLLTFGHKPKYFPFIGRIYRFFQDFYAFNDLLFEGAIWNHKIYKERPLLQQHERTIPQFRRWYQQFYEIKK